jgi:MoaA/NifB/PqqE/SkfB family radical SAM enzyme
MEGKCLS